ncbi:MAG: glycine-rich domain-containing protein [Beijerinckiaceae bacterium]
MLTDPELWKRIDAFQIDDPSADLMFSDRLARENSWDKRFTLHTIEEYKRFLYLACVAEHQVTPSDAVDQAWHLHLVYTHSYWDVLCKTVLQRPLHHGPTKGGNSEASRYSDNYLGTLAAYQREFDEVAPADIWPDVERRFDTRLHAVKIVPDSYWLIPKPSELDRIALSVAGGFVMAFASLILLSIRSNDSAKESGPDVLLMLFIVASAVAFLWPLSVLFRRMLKRKQSAKHDDPAKKKDGSGCSPYASSGGSGCANSGGSGCGSSGCGSS